VAVAEAEAVWAPVEESETVPVTVVEAEPWSGARRHGAEEEHSLQAPLVEEPEKVTAVEALDDAGTPVRARRSVQVVAGPRVARVEVPASRVARRGASGASGPRMARPKAPSPRQVRHMAPEPQGVDAGGLDAVAGACGAPAAARSGRGGRESTTARVAAGSGRAVRNPGARAPGAGRRAAAAA
jgi:hypothetical protein